MEHWKNIYGFEGYYEISDCGNIRALQRFTSNKKGVCAIQNRKPQSIKIFKHNNGYMCVNLSKDSIKRQYLVHRLAGLTFILNPENKPQINHIDGNKTNNRIENLEWATSNENQKHRYEKLGHSAHNKGKFLGQSHVAQSVIAIKDCAIMEFDCLKTAAITLNIGYLKFLRNARSGKSVNGWTLLKDEQCHATH